MDLQRLEIHSHLHGGRTKDHRWQVRRFSCDGRSAFLLRAAYGWRTRKGRVDVLFRRAERRQARKFRDHANGRHASKSLITAPIVCTRPLQASWFWDEELGTFLSRIGLATLSPRRFGQLMARRRRDSSEYEGPNRCVALLCCHVCTETVFTLY